MMDISGHYDATSPR